jgi:hypothetical protein
VLALLSFRRVCRTVPTMINRHHRSSAWAGLLLGAAALVLTACGNDSVISAPVKTPTVTTNRPGAAAR